MLKKMMKGLMAAAFMAALTVTVASAGDKPKCCAMGAKGKDKVCTMDAKTLKDCPMSKKATSKDSMVMYVCPMKDYASSKPGDCPNCKMKLEKMYCNMDAKDMKGASKCPYLSGQMDKDGKMKSDSKDMKDMKMDAKDAPKDKM
jgi:hypothetical protein